MSTATASALPLHLQPRREKVFGEGRPRAMDRNAKMRVMIYARALMRSTEKGKAYGQVSAKALAVLETLLWGFHNARDGRCFPSYETIAARAGCARCTVAQSIKALEDAGILTWVNRLARVRERCEDLFGKMGIRWRVIRISNAYHFLDPKTAGHREFPSKSDFQCGTSIQELPIEGKNPETKPYDPDPELSATLLSFGKTIGAVK
jgi:hypothetical protein